MAVSVCLILACWFLYAPAKQYYVTARSFDRLEAEYSAVQEHNQTLQKQVDSLSSPAGIEDRARKEFGWIKEGEQGGTVYGIEREPEEVSYTKTVAPGSVEAPQAWYTALLDVVFGVK